ncbi:hypothetical protein PS420_02210 [Pediococcus acidilactici]
MKKSKSAKGIGVLEIVGGSLNLVGGALILAAGIVKLTNPRK